MSGGSQIFFGAATPACWTVHETRHAQTPWKVVTPANISQPLDRLCVAVRGAAGGGARVQGEADRGGGGQDLTVLQPPHLLHRRHLQVLRQDPRLQRSLQGGQGAALQISLSRAFHPSPFTQVSKSICCKT